MKTNTYQGWTNYETWAVNLWLTNDSGIYDMIREMGQEAKEAAPELEAVKDEIWTVEEGAKFTLADKIKDYIEENNPLRCDQKKRHTIYPITKPLSFYTLSH